jgi:hypothetical protein
VTATHSTRTGLGPGQMRTPVLPAALAQVDGARELMQRVLADSYVAALRPSLAVVAGALLLGALTCLWIRHRIEIPEPASKSIRREGEQAADLAPALEGI